MVEIRPATVDDVPAILGLAKRMHAESPRFSRRAFSAAKCEAALAALLAGRLTGSTLVAEKDRTIIGMMVGIVTEHFFGTEKMATDLALYIAPEHRGGSLAPKLIKAFEKAMRATGAVEVSLGISTEIAAERTVELYRAQGYRLSGYSMLKELF